MSLFIPRFGDARDWFFEKRFGLFVHWGLYALPAWHEQDQWRRRWSRAEYEKLALAWNPAKYDPDGWLDMMEEAGMEYICLTTKHHDGFCLWDTKQTEFNTCQTPYGRDIVAMLAEACDRRGFPLCLYYSCVDWHHPNYPNQGRHHELPGPEPGDVPDHDRYLDFLRAQVRELCTQYGPIGAFWWDMNVEEHRDSSINATIRQLQPGAVINNRGYDEGDFGTPERDWDGGADALRVFLKPTEANTSVGTQSWGYRTGEDFYTDRHLMRSLDKYLCRGANYLLNVGPTSEGIITAEYAGIVRRVGQWQKKMARALRAEPAPALAASPDLLLTREGETLFVHLFKEPTSDAVNLKPLDIAPSRATLVNNEQPVVWTLEMAPWDHRDGKGFLRLRELPVNQPPGLTEPLVIALEFPPGALDTFQREQEQLGQSAAVPSGVSNLLQR